MTYYERIEQAVRFLKKHFGGSLHVDCSIVLGSGLGRLTDELEKPVTVGYRDIPGFGTVTIPGHRGELVFGRFAGKKCAVFSGRFHYYQGYSMQEVTLPIRVMKQLGVQTAVLTNSAGGINREFKPGDIMLIRDHINMMGSNPLRGIDSRYYGSPFVDMSAPYDPSLIGAAKEIAARDPSIGRLREGVYIAVSGPSYETSAEIECFRRAGADAVGMSTVPEVIVCAQEGIRVLGISIIANSATGVSKRPLSHEEVLETTGRTSTRVVKLIGEILRNVV